MGKLGDLYFDVVLQYKAGETRNNIKKDLAGLSADISKELGAQIAKQLSNVKAKVSAEFKDDSLKKLSDIKSTATITVLKTPLIASVKEALKEASFQINIKATGATANISGLQEAKIAAQRALAQKRAASAALSEERLRSARTRTTEATNRANSSESIRSRVLMSSNGVMRGMISTAGQYISIFAAGSLLSSLVRIRGEFDMQFISLQSILQSGRQAEELFSKLQGLAVKSPFQFSQLTTYTKMLSAYQIPEQDLFDTTKRLADLSAGLGVDMQRIILAYGQVKAAAVLRGQELRQFTEAGIPLVQKLADKFSVLEGRVVSTNEVFDKISTRQVSFGMVKDVIDDMTNEGGMFFEMQEKQAESLKGKVSNLTDAYQIMMNKIGMANDGILKGGVEMLTSAMNNYKTLISTLFTAIAVYGTYKAYIGTMNVLRGKETLLTLAQELAEKKANASRLRQLSAMKPLTEEQERLIATKYRLTMEEYKNLASSGKLSAVEAQRLFIMGKINSTTFKMMANASGMNEAMVNNIASVKGYRKALLGASMMFGQYDEQMVRSIATAGKFKGSMLVLSGAFKALGSSLLNLATNPMTWIMVAVGAITSLTSYISDIERQESEMRKSLVEGAKGTIDEIDAYIKNKKPMFNVLYNAKSSDDEVNKMVTDLEDEIRKLMGDDADAVLADLFNIKDMRERGKEAVDIINNVRDAMIDIKNWEITVNKDTWLNGLFGEGLVEDVQDFTERLGKAKQLAKSAGKDIKTYLADELEKGGGYSITDQLKTDLREAMDELKPTIEDLKAKLYEMPEERRYGALHGWLKTFFEQNPEIDDNGKLLISVEIEKQTLGKSATMMRDFWDSLSSDRRKQLGELGDTLTDEQKKMLNTWLEEYRGKKGMYVSYTQDIADAINNSNIMAYIKIKLDYDQTQLTGLSNLFYNALPGGSMKMTKTQFKNKYPAVVTAVGDNTGYEGMQAIQSANKKSKDELKFYEDVISGKKNSTISKEEARKFAEAEKEKQKQYQEVADILNFSITGDTKKTGKNSQTNTTDKIAKAWKERYDVLRNAITEYSKLRKSMSEEKAKGALLNMPGFENLNDREKGYLSKEGMSKLNVYYGVKARSRNTNEAKSLSDTIQKSNQDLAQAKVEEELAKAVDKVSNSLTFGREQFSLYDKILAQTGDTAMSAMLAFGNIGQIYKDVADLEIAKFDEESKLRGGSAYSVMLGMSEDELAKVPEELLKRFKEVRNIIGNEQNDIIVRAAAAFQKQMSIDDKVTQKKAEKERERIKLLNALKDKGMSEEDASNSGLMKALLQEYDDEINKLTEDSIELNDVWKRLFADTAEMGRRKIKGLMNDVKKTLDSAKKLSNGKYSISLFEDGKETGNKTITEGKLKELSDRFKKLGKELRKDNPFQAIKDIFSDATDKDGKIDWSKLDLEALGEQLEAIGGIIGDVTSQAGDMFGALGNEGAADALNMIGELTKSLGSMASGIAKMASGDYIVGGIQAVSGLFSTLTSIFNQHDKFLEKSIQKSQERVEEISNLQNELDRLIKRSLGGAYTASIGNIVEDDKRRLAELEPYYKLYTSGKLPNIIKKSYQSQYEEYLTLQKRLESVKGSKEGAPYLYQQALLEEQLLELEKQKAAEEDKKKKDQSAINDYNDQISELQDTIRYFSEDTLKSLLDIDLKGWADQISEALVNAFASGENAVEAFDSTVGSIMKSVVNKMSSLYILEPMFESLRTYLFGDDGKGGVFGADKHMSLEDINGMIPFFDEYKNGIEDINELWNAIEGVMKENGYSMSDSNTASSMSGNIKDITEDQANLLASYINAIRADVSVKRAIIEKMGYEMMPKITALVEAQVRQLTAIAANTNRNADFCERIYDLFNSVTSVTNQGKKIRI